MAELLSISISPTRPRQLRAAPPPPRPDLPISSLVLCTGALHLLCLRTLLHPPPLAKCSGAAASAGARTCRRRRRWPSTAAARWGRHGGGHGSGGRSGAPPLRVRAPPPPRPAPGGQSSPAAAAEVLTSRSGRWGEYRPRPRPPRRPNPHTAAGLEWRGSSEEEEQGRPPSPSAHPSPHFLAAPGVLPPPLRARPASFFLLPPRGGSRLALPLPSLSGGARTDRGAATAARGRGKSTGCVRLLSPGHVAPEERSGSGGRLQVRPLQGR